MTALSNRALGATLIVASVFGILMWPLLLVANGAALSGAQFTALLPWLLVTFSLAYTFVAFALLRGFGVRRAPVSSSPPPSRNCFRL